MADELKFGVPHGEKVYICKHLQEKSAELGKVYHFDTPEFAWSFVCDAEKHDNADIAESTLGEVLKLFPEIENHAGCPHNCMKAKGEETGDWYLFKFKGRNEE